MSLKKTIILAIVLAVVALYILRVDMPRVAEEERKGLRFPDLKASEIESIQISKSDHVFTLKNKEAKKIDVTDEGAILATSDNFSSWELESVPGSSLDQSALNSAISALRQLKLDDVLLKSEIETDLETYGLKTPALTIKINTLDGAEEFRLGKLNNYTNQRYLQVPGSDSVYLVGDQIFTSFNKSENDYRDRTPIEFIDSDLKRVTIESDKSRLVLELDNQFKWQILEPLKAIANEQEVLSITRALRNIRTEEFINDKQQLAKYNLDKPQVRATLEFNDTLKKSPIEIGISEKQTEVNQQTQSKTYVLVSGLPSIYAMTASPVKSLVKTAEELREKKLFTFPVERTQKLIITGSDREPLNVAREGEAWKVNGRDGDRVFVNQLLNDLSKLEAQSFPEADKVGGFETPRLEIVLELAGDKIDSPSTSRKLLVGSEMKVSGNKLYAVSIDGLPYPISISEDVLKKISVREEALIATPTPVATAAVTNKP